MKPSTRNVYYWIIVRDYLQSVNPIAIDKKYHELDFVVMHILDELAEAMRVRPENGKSPARTLWDRAMKGRPF